VIVAAVNDDRMVLAVNTEPYPWHEHPDSDELFLVLEGTLRLDVAGGRSVDLGPFDTCVIRAGEVHRTTPVGRCVNLVFKRADGGTRFIK
jgi:mannose-6-phosphate isomerase-like protein (cupin superfamily)